VRVTPIFLLSAVHGYGLAGLLIRCSARCRSFHLTRDDGRGADIRGRARLLFNIGRSSARSWRASRCFAAPASRAQSVHLPLARLPGRPRLFSSVARLAMHSSPSFRL